MKTNGKNFTPFEPYAARLNTEIERVFDDFLRIMPDFSEHANWAVDHIKMYSLRPGKRIRGSLAAAAYDQIKGEPYSQVGLRLGAAIELIQNHLLIIDDVIDRSDLRRGQPTVHRVYQRQYNADIREADMVAILIGLLPGQIANFAIATIDEESRYVTEAQALIARDLAITDLAQIDDMHHTASKKTSLDSLLRKHEQKSSYYSFVSPLAAGLLLAGIEPDKARRDAEKYGRPAGIAFQLQDDHLGLFGDSQTTGKPVFDDMREGKYTLMIHYAFEAATTEERWALEGILGDHTAAEDQLAQLQQIVKRTEADIKARKTAEKYAATAKDAAHGATAWSQEFGEILASLVDFSIGRKA